jgi:hypothetical protein
MKTLGAMFAYFSMAEAGKYTLSNGAFNNGASASRTLDGVTKSNIYNYIGTSNSAWTCDIDPAAKVHDLKLYGSDYWGAYYTNLVVKVGDTVCNRVGENTVAANKALRQQSEPMIYNCGGASGNKISLIQASGWLDVCEVEAWGPSYPKYDDLHPGANTFVLYKNAQDIAGYSQLSSAQFLAMYDKFQDQYNTFGGLAVYEEFESLYCSLCFNDNKRLFQVNKANSGLIKPGHVTDNKPTCRGYQHVKAKLCNSNNCFNDASSWDAAPVVKSSIYCKTDKYMGLYARDDYITAFESYGDNDASNNIAFTSGDSAFAYDSNSINAKTFVLGPHNEGISGYEQVTFHQLDNGLWEAFKEFYETQGGISTHHDYYSKWCSICLKNNYRLKISGKDQTSGSTYPGQNGSSTCSAADRNRSGTYQLCSSKKACYSELADLSKWVHDKSSYCKDAQGIYVSKTFLQAANMVDAADN